MLELFLNMDKKVLLNNTFQNEELSNFDSNILYLEYTSKGLEVKNLTKGCFEEDVENPNVIFKENIKNIEYFNLLNSHFLENSKNLNFNIYEYMSKYNLLQFTKENISVDALMTGNEALAGPSGPNFWIFNIAYLSIGKISSTKINKDYIDWMSTVFKEKINTDVKGYGVNKDLFSLSEKDLISKLDTLNSFIKKDFDIDANNKLPTIIISNFFNFNHKFDLENIHNDLFKYHQEKLNKENDFDIETSCKMCNSKENLIKDGTYVQNRDLATHIFSLTKERINSQFQNKAFALCLDCNNKLKEINATLKENKVKYLTLSIDKIDQEIKPLSSLSDLRNIEEFFLRTGVYKISEDSLDKTYNINFVFDFNNRKNKNRGETFNLLQSLFLFRDFNKEDKWRDNWIDTLNQKVKDDSFEGQKQLIIRNNKNELFKIFFSSGKASYKLINYLLTFYIKNFESDKLNKFNFKSLFYFDEKKKSILEKLLMEEHRMFEKQQKLAEKLDLLDNIQNELDFFSLDISDEEFWLLAGRVFGYLNSKNKSDDKDLSYFNNLKHISNKKILELLHHSFLIYGYDINDNQIKFKIIYSYLIDELNEGNRKIDDKTLYHFISGALNSKIIKLIKKNNKIGEK